MIESQIFTGMQQYREKKNKQQQQKESSLGFLCLEYAISYNPVGKRFILFAKCIPDTFSL